PWREEVLKGMMGADLVGFHTASYLHHFRMTLRRVLNLEADRETVQEVGRNVRLGVFSLGIDAAAFSRLAADGEVVAEAPAIRKQTGARTLLVGVDRLDHTKGLVRRMLGLERLFERSPALRNKVRLVQIVVPSRTKVDAYAALRRQLDETVGRING